MDKAGPSRWSKATDGDRPNWAIRESKTCQSRIAENSTPSLQGRPSTIGHIAGQWPSFPERLMDPNPNHPQPSPMMLPGYDRWRPASQLPHAVSGLAASTSSFVPQQPTVDDSIPEAIKPASQAVAGSLLSSSSSRSNGRGIQLGVPDNNVDLCLTSLQKYFQLRIQWHNYETASNSFQRVDNHDGGGTLEVSCECSVPVAIVLNQAIRRYFPNGRNNSHGSFASEFNFGLADQNMNCFEEAELQLPLLQALQARSIYAEPVCLNLMSRPFAEQPSELPEKPPRLPFDCMLPVFQFLPTSELIRFVSKYRDPFGAHWSQALSHVLERQRLPLTVSINTQSRATSAGDLFHKRSSADRPAWNARISDATGAHVATIKHPKFFARSPVAKFVEQAVFSDRVAYIVSRFHGIFLDIPPPIQRLLSLENLYTLTFGRIEASTFDTASNDSASLNRLPVEKLKSLTIKEAASCGVVCVFRTEALLRMAQAINLETLDMVLVEAFAAALPAVVPNLETLDATIAVFAAALPAIVPYKQVFNNATKNESEVFAGLLVLRLWSWGCHHGHLESRLLWYIRTRCLQLRELSLIVNINEELWPYFAAFRALQKLTRLGLNVVAKGRRSMTGLELLPNKLNEIQNEAEVTTVLDLRISADFRLVETQGAVLLALLKKFPYAKAFSLAAQPAAINPSQLLQLLQALRLTKTLPALNSFACIAEIGRPHSPSDVLLELMNLPHLPETVDLSDLVFQACNAKPCFISDLWRNMRSANQIIRLDVRCVVRLQDVRDFREANDKQNARDTARRLVCWQDIKSRSLQVVGQSASDQACDYINYKITGTKATGGAKGRLFSAFVHHQAKERVSLLQKR